jgi:hypothetical protein
MQINELSMGKLEGGLAKVYEIYEESLKEGIGMVSLFKVEKDGLLIEGNSTVNPYGGNIVHSIAGVGVAVASSLNDLQQSGLFEDLGGFGGRRSRAVNPILICLPTCQELTRHNCRAGI